MGRLAPVEGDGQGRRERLGTKGAAGVALKAAGQVDGNYASPVAGAGAGGGDARQRPGKIGAEQRVDDQLRLTVLGPQRDRLAAPLRRLGLSLWSRRGNRALDPHRPAAPLKQ